MSILLVSTLQTKLDRLQTKIKQKGLSFRLLFRKAGVRLNPKNPWSHYHLAKCLLELKRWQDAEVVYRKTLELNLMSLGTKTMARCRGGLPKNLRTQSRNCPSTS
ncbi:tetratricopeptide repeat protein [Sodalinema gerasimenkoae]|uniref:tetratricopeptide repeat protein n=1 Tax=Sodalinema gerasimenkoae TaxID=2862348 RepID=UPI003CCD9D59